MRRKKNILLKIDDYATEGVIQLTKFSFIYSRCLITITTTTTSKFLKVNIYEEEKKSKTKINSHHVCSI